MFDAWAGFPVNPRSMCHDLTCFRLGLCVARVRRLCRDGPHEREHEREDAFATRPPRELYPSQGLPPLSQSVTTYEGID